jgi:hypothetical protein
VDFILFPSTLIFDRLDRTSQRTRRVAAAAVALPASAKISDMPPTIAKNFALFITSFLLFIFLIS